MNLYLDWRNSTEMEGVKITPYDVKAGDENKRMNVYAGQLMNDVVENITLKNYLMQIGIFYKLGDNLLKKYPHRSDELYEASLQFWEKTQIKLKKLKQCDGDYDQEK